MEPENRPPGVMLYFDQMRPIFALLTAGETGDLVQKILDYAEYGTEPDFPSGDRLCGLWPSIQKWIDRDAAAYQKKCEHAKKAAQARWDRQHGADRKEPAQEAGTASRPEPQT